MKIINVLMIEDNEDDYIATLDAFNRFQSSTTNNEQQFKLDWRPTLARGLEALNLSPYEVLLLDLSLPDADGTEAIEKVKDKFPRLPIVVFTGQDSGEVAISALRSGAQDYLIKHTLSPEGLTRSIRYAMERQQILEQLETAEKEARSAMEAKSAFLSQMSHEIRTPLTAIVGFSEALADSGLCAEERGAIIDSIQRNSQHLIRLVSDVLDLAKIEQGKLEIDFAAVSPFDVLRQLDRQLGQSARSKGLKFEVAHKFPLPRHIRTDYIRLLQVLINLTSNAIKYTERGSVILGVELLETIKQLRFYVKDTGIGVPADIQEKIFEPFEQGSIFKDKKIEGTGLGLSICRKLAILLSGVLELQSQTGSGSTFSFSVPVGDAELKDLVLDVPPSIEGEVYRSGIPQLQGRVLLIEDGKDNQQLISYLVRKTGAKCHVVSNGLEALEFLKSTSSPLLDLLLMDMQMPKMNGYDAVRELRSIGVKTPIVAVSASVSAWRQAEFPQIGCDGFLPKPFQHADLYRVLNDHLKPREVEPKGVQEDLSRDKELEKISKNYARKLPMRLKALEDNLSNRNWTELDRLAHQLTNAELFGFPDLSKISRKLQETVVRMDEESSRRLVTEMWMLLPAERVKSE